MICIKLHFQFLVVHLMLVQHRVKGQLAVMFYSQKDLSRISSLFPLNRAESDFEPTLRVFLVAGSACVCQWRQAEQLHALIFKCRGDGL